MLQGGRLREKRGARMNELELEFSEKKTHDDLGALVAEANRMADFAVNARQI